MKRVVVLGASTKPERHAHRAQQMLMNRGYEVVPINRTGEPVLGVRGFSRLTGIPPTSRPVDTVTVYLAPARFESLGRDVLDLGPSRVIFNPGSENPAWSERLQEAGIEVLDACTLVMLSTETFDEPGD